MLTSHRKERPDFWNEQLSLDFNTHSIPSPRTRIADQVDAITSNKIAFHDKESEIGGNNFSLKVSYMGRSYSLKGMYRKEEIRSFNQKDYSNTTISNIRFDSILAFRDGRYISAFLPPKDYNKITENIHTILSSPHYNKTLH